MNATTQQKWNTQLNNIEQEIFNNALWKGYIVLRHERYADGSYITEKSTIPRVFLHNGQLYYPNFASFTSTIISLSELNMDKDNLSCGVYFEVKYKK